MHQEILLPEQVELLPLLKSFAKDFYLVGGTAIALHVGHRRSVDFDLFTNHNLHRIKIKNTIKKTDLIINRVIHESAEQLHLIVNNVKLTFYNFPYSITAPDWLGTYIAMPDLLTLAAMKAFALGGRAKWKDYVDLYFLLNSYYSFHQVSDKAKTIFQSMFNEKLFRQQLAYYTDIDYSETIDYIAMSPSEAEIKQFLTEVSLQPF